MAKYTTFINCTIFLAIFVSLLMHAGCASIQQPQGGPRDTIPPKVVSMEPENLQTNFSAKKVTIEFDEYFTIKEEFKEFSISPATETAPVLKKKGKKLEITFPDSLEKNTPISV